MAILTAVVVVVEHSKHFPNCLTCLSHTLSKFVFVYGKSRFNATPWHVIITSRMNEMWQNLSFLHRLIFYFAAIHGDSCNFMFMIQDTTNLCIVSVIST